LGVIGIVALLMTSSLGGRFVVDPAASSLHIHTGRAGILKFAGHDHDIRGLGMSGEILADTENVAASRVTITLDATRLEVEREGEPPADVAQVQERMLGPDVLDTARFPEIVFRSISASGHSGPHGSAFDMEIQGDLSLHGVTRRIALRLKAAIEGDLLKASGEARLRQTDYGLNPVSAVAGTVRVKDEVLVRYSIVARRASGGS
jgi:polyisoprenoid-binding protein YceI